MTEGYYVTEQITVIQRTMADYLKVAHALRKCNRKCGHKVNTK